MPEIRNALIEDVTLSMADQGCLMYGLTLHMNGAGCIYGGIAIGCGYLGAEKFEEVPHGVEALMHIMNVIGVSRWENLKGKYCRVVIDGPGCIVNKIGNIIEDKWFDQKAFFNKYHQKEA